MTNQDAQWKEIPEFPGYFISDGGRVFHLQRQHMMKPSYNGSGEYVTLTRDKKKYTRKISVLKQAAFPETPSYHPPDVQIRIATFGRYTIDINGVVRDRKFNNRVVIPFPGPRGSARVTLRDASGGTYDRGVRKLVIETFRLSPEEARAYPRIITPKTGRYKNAQSDSSEARDD